MARPPGTGSQFNTVLRSLGLSANACVWRKEWNQTQQTFPSGPVPFLQPARIDSLCHAWAVCDEVRDALLRATRAFAGNESLRRLAWHCHRRMLSGDRDLTPEIHAWPTLPAASGLGADLFYAIVLLSAIPHLRALHRQRNIPRAVTLDTVSDLALWILDHKQRHGRLGFSQKGWMSRHFTVQLFQLGRLQFAFETFPFDIRAFRHRRNRSVTLLADSRSDRNLARGRPILPGGHIETKPVTLSRNEWVEILCAGDPVLGVHIPATGPMDPERCGESFAHAIRFFARHFPERPFRAFTCSSWLLDSQLASYLPVASNIVRFQREWHLHAIPNADDRQIFERVFGGKPANWSTAPQDTRLRRAVIQHAESGGHWRTGGGILFAEDLDWGAPMNRKKK